MPPRIPHVQALVPLATGPAPPGPPDNPLAIECTWMGLRYALWCALFFAQSLRRPDFQHHVSRLLRDVDRELAELELS